MLEFSNLYPLYPTFVVIKLESEGSNLTCRAEWLVGRGEVESRLKQCLPEEGTMTALVSILGRSVRIVRT